MYTANILIVDSFDTAIVRKCQQFENVTKNARNLNTLATILELAFTLPFTTPLHVGHIMSDDYVHRFIDRTGLESFESRADRHALECSAFSLCYQYKCHKVILAISQKPYITLIAYQ